MTRCPFCLESIEGQFPCPFCGFSPADDQWGWNRLAPGTLLQDRYMVGGVLGRGGFGITYRGKDLKLGLPVAIKEYFPGGIAVRESTSRQVAPSRRDDEADFAKGMDRFQEEASLLARFEDHPTIVSVRDHFRANGTVYMVMPLLQGVTLAAYVTNKGGRLLWKQALSILVPVMDALEEVHRSGWVHLDVSPDNIFITQSGQVRLLDFGAAKVSAGLAMQRSHSVVLKKGYAPPEQYQTQGKLGPWTDVYGLAATLYRCVVGQAPPDALDRLGEDVLTPPGQMGVALEGHIEEALLAGLALSPKVRPQSMRAFQALLLDPSAENVPAPRRAEPLTPSVSVPGPGGPAEGGGQGAGGNLPEGRGKPKKTRLPLLAGIAGAALLVAGLVGVSLKAPVPQAGETVMASPTVAPEAQEKAVQEPEPAVTEPPAEDPLPEQDPGDVVRRYYDLVQRGGYEDAYGLLSQGKRSKAPYHVWVEGYGSTVRHEVENLRVGGTQQGRARVRVSLLAVDRTDTEGVFQRRWFDVLWLLIPEEGEWRLDSATTRLVKRDYDLTGQAEPSEQEGALERVAQEEPERVPEPTRISRLPDPKPTRPVVSHPTSSPPAVRRSDSSDPLGEGMRLVQSKRYAQAIPLLEAARSKDGGDIRVYQQLGIAYLGAGQNERVVQLAKESLLVDSRDSTMRWLAAYAQARMGDLNQAIATMEKAVYADKSSFQNRKALTAYLILAGRNGEAMNACDDALKVKEQDPTMHYWKACLFLDDKSLVGAMREVEILERLGSPLARKFGSVFPQPGEHPSASQLAEIDRLLGEFRRSVSP